MTKMPAYLMIAVYPNAYVYFDRIREIHGDYHEIAVLYFQPLRLKIFDDSEEYADAIMAATAEYNKIKANINTPIVISMTGQTVQPYLDEE